MRKKLLVGVLCAMVVLAGCNRNNANNDNNGSTSSGGSAVEESNGSANESDGSADGAGGSVDESDSSVDNGGAQSVVSDATIEETVVLDQDDIKITATELDVNGDMGPELKLAIENNSSKYVSISAQNSSINGYMIDGFIYTELSAGKKANSSMVFDTKSLEASGIKDIASIEFSIVATDLEAFDTLFQSDRIALTTSVGSGYEQAYDDSGEIIFDENGIKIVYQKFVADDAQSYSSYAVLYAENNSDKDINIYSESASVNESMVDGYLTSASIMAGKKSVMRFSFRTEDLAENGIEGVERIETTFVISDINSYEQITKTPAISIDVQ